MKVFSLLLFALFFQIASLEAVATIQHSEHHFSVSDNSLLTLALPETLSSEESIHATSYKLKKSLGSGFSTFTSRVNYSFITSQTEPSGFDHSAYRPLRYKICVLRI